MPRKKKHGKQSGGGSSSKHPKHAKNAVAAPGGKGNKKVDKQETRTQNLQQLQEMFEGKLDAVLVHMIMEDCNYNVETALETLFKLAGDGDVGHEFNHGTELPREFVGYSGSDESDDSEDSEDYPNVVNPGETGSGAGASADVKPPPSSRNGVGLDDISLGQSIKGLDFAIAMAKELDRNAFSEESIEKVTAGLVAYRDTGDKNKLKELGPLSAIAEMVLEVGAKEEEKEITKSSQVRFKSPHSRLPVYSATDDRLVGGMSSSSGSSASSSPSHSGDERDPHDGSYSAFDSSMKVEIKDSGYEHVKPKDAGATAFPMAMPATESNEKSQGKSSLNNGDGERPLHGALNPNVSNNSAKNPTPGSTVENRSEEMSSVKPKAKVTFWNNLTTDQAEAEVLSDEDSEKDIDKHISFQEDSESYRGDGLERDSVDNELIGGERSNLLRSQHLTKTNNSIDRAQDVNNALGREQVVNPFSVERPVSHPDERFLVNERGQGTMNMPQMPSSRPKQGPGNNPYGHVQPGNNQFFPQYNPLNAPPPGMNRHGINEHRPFVHGANFMPAFGVGTTHIFLKNITPGLLPRTYQKDGQPPPKSFQPYPKQSYSRAFFTELPPGAGGNTGPYPPHTHISNVFGFQGPQLRSPPLRSNLTITELPPSPEEPITSTNMQEVSSGPPRFPMVQQTNVNRNQYPQAPAEEPVTSTNMQELLSGPPRRPMVQHANLNHNQYPPAPAEEPVDSTNMQEVSSGPPRWPMVQHTNLKRNQYPPAAPGPRLIPPLPPGKVLCLMRGCPGSGKSTLAKSLKGDGVILSSDDFFMVNGQYRFDGNLVGEAHDWNHKRAGEYLEKGTSPIIIDNTNIMAWEMKPYVAMALRHQYQIVIREADTPWKNKAGELAKRNSHGVPKIAITRMLQNYNPNVTVESIMNAPDKKKTPEYISKLNQEGPDQPEEDGRGPRISQCQGDKKKNPEYNAKLNQEGPNHPGGDGRGPRMSRHQGDQVRSGDGGKNHQGSASGDDIDEPGWETVGSHRGGQDHGGQNGHGRGNHWNQQRGGRGGGGGKKDLHHRNNLKGGSPRRYNNEHPVNRYHMLPEGAEGYTGGSGRTKPSSHMSPKRNQSPSQSKRNSPKDRGQPDDEGWISSPKRGRRVGGGAHSPSPNRGYEKKRNPRATRGGKQNQSSPDNKPFDEAIRFLESDDSLSQDPMKRLINDIRITSSTLSSNSGIDQTIGKTNQSTDRLLDRTLPVSNRRSPLQTESPQMKQDLVQEMVIEQTNTSNNQTLLQNTQLSSSDNQQGSSSSSASLPQELVSDCDEKTYGMLLADNLQGNNDSSLDLPVKIDASINGTDRSKEDIVLPTYSDYGKNINGETDLSTAEGPHLTSSDKFDDHFESSPTTKLGAIHVSPQLQEEEDRSPSQCQSRESSRAPTPSLRRTSRRLSGGKSSRRLAAVFTSPTNPAPPTTFSPLTSPAPETSPAPPGPEDADWAKYDPSRNIPKPVFPIGIEEATASTPDLADKNTSTDGQDFSFLQRIVRGTIQPEDLPEGYVCRTAVVVPLRKADNIDDTAEEDRGLDFSPRDGSSPIPLSVKLHKGCMTEEIEEEATCNMEDEKVSMLETFFPSSSTKDLKSLLDTCAGDVELATNVLLDSLDQVGVSPVMDRNAPVEEVQANATETSNASSENVASSKNVVEAEEIAPENNHRIGDALDQTDERSMQGMNAPMGSDSSNCLREQNAAQATTEGNHQSTAESGGASLDDQTSKRLDNEKVPSDTMKQPSNSRSSSRIDALNKLASDSQRFASELEQANQIVFSNTPKAPTEHSQESTQANAAGLETHDTGKITTLDKNSSGNADVNRSKDDGSPKQEADIEEDEENTESDEFEEFTNNFYSGASKLVKPKSTSCSTAGTSDDELPMLESFMEDKQMLQLAAAAASNNLDDAVHGHSKIAEDTLVLLHQPTQSLPMTNAADEQVEEKPLHSKDSVTSHSKSESPSTSAKEEEMTPPADQSTPLSELSNQTQHDKHGVVSHGQDFTESNAETGTSSLKLCQVPTESNHETGTTSPKISQNLVGSSNEKGTSSPKIHQETDQFKGDDADKVLQDSQDSAEPSVEELSDSDIPWKSGYDVIEPEADAATPDPSDKFNDSGAGVYDYLGGMVLQMDAAFALQLQELFGQVGFHLDPDMLSPDDLKVKIGYQVAKQLHTAWSQGLKERFHNQEKQLEEMLQRDEELARKLQQEENLKKLAKSHRGKKPAKFVPPGSPKGSPKWSKKRQKEPDPARVVIDGGQDVMRGEQVLVGGGLRNLGELGAMGGTEFYPPPVQRIEVPELAQIMAEEEIRQEREKKGMWNSPEKANTIATKLKRDQLYEAFPDVNKKALDDIFAANNYDLQSTMWEVNAVYRESGPVKDVFSPEALVEMEKRRERSQARAKEETDGQFQSTEQPDYEDYRAEATLHFNQRDECFKKAAKAYHSGQKDLALHYSNQGRLHSMRLKEANRRAAELILVQRKHITGENKLDLHNLHVEEALQALQEVLMEREQQARHGTPSPGQQRYLEVVTGRGRHSQGGVAKLKPAVSKFLEQRGYRFTNPNAGCLRVYFS